MVSETDGQVGLVLISQGWWSELWDEVMEGGVTPLPFAEDTKEVSDVGDDAIDKLSNPPEEQVYEPVAFSVIQCHCKLLEI